MAPVRLIDLARVNLHEISSQKDTLKTIGIWKTTLDVNNFGKCILDHRDHVHYLKGRFFEGAHLTLGHYSRRSFVQGLVYKCFLWDHILPVTKNSIFNS